MPVGEIADDAPQRRRKALDQCGRRENLVVLGQLRMLEYVDDLQLVILAELLVAYSLEVRDSGICLRALASDVELQQVLRQRDLRSGRMGSRR